MNTFKEWLNEAKTDIIYQDKRIGYIKTSIKNNIINIDDIEVYKSGTQSGTNAIRDVIHKADNEGLIVTLTSDAMRGKSGQKKNRELYTKLGFIKNSGKNKRKDISEEFYYIGKKYDRR